MTDPLSIVMLALADSVNPITIGMVLEALVVRRALRHATLFASATLVVNAIAAWLIIQGLDLITGLQQSSWPAMLIALAGVLLLAQGVWDAIRAHRDPDATIRLWFSIAGAGPVKTIVIAAAVNLGLLPLGAQMVVAMVQVSAMDDGALVEWGWALAYSAIYTLPLWLIIAIGSTPLASWRPRSALVGRYGAAAASIFFGLALIVLGVAS